MIDLNVTNMQLSRQRRSCLVTNLKTQSYEAAATKLQLELSS